MSLTHVVQGVAHTDERLDLVWTVLESLLVVLDCTLEVGRLEQEIAHVNKSKHVLWIQVDALFKELGRKL